MSDIVDDAQVVEELERDAALRRLLSADATTRRVAEGVCSGCGEEIEPERREVQPNACRCLQCQEARERSARLFRKFA
jgi:RNA polymerase-binding transcription factor DksA